MRYLLNNDNVTGEAILISLALIVIISTLATLYCLNNYFFRLKSPKMTCILNSRTLRLMNVTGKWLIVVGGLAICPLLTIFLFLITHKLPLISKVCLALEGFALQHRQSEESYPLAGIVCYDDSKIQRGNEVNALGLLHGKSL